MSDLLQVGFGRVDITPEEYCGLAGYGTDFYRICNTVKDRVFGTCVAITDSDNKTVLLFTVDLLQSKETTVVAYGREAITAATGVPGEQIMISATHTHSGPSMYTMEEPSQKRYILYLSAQLAKAAKCAMENRAPAQVEIGHKRVERMTFVRHYLMNDGTYAGPNFGSFKSGCKAHLAEADEQLQMICFKRQDARDIVLINWQSHGTFVGHPDEGVMSADYIGVLRDHFEGLSGCHMAFFQGACGNLVPASKIPEENLFERDMYGYGRHLAEEAFALTKELTPVNSGSIRNRQYTYRGEVDHSDDHLVPAARYVQEHYYKLSTVREQYELRKSYGFNSIYHANQVVNRFNRGTHVEMELDALCIGDIAFATFPYEMFCSNGMYLKEHAPFKMTFVMGYCNGSFSYIADNNAFGYDCYEVNSRIFNKGVAEHIVDTQLSVLEQLKNQ